MRLPSPKTALVALMVMCGLVAAPASAQPVNALASYVVNLNGINVAYVTIRLEVEGTSYALDLSADVAGLAQMVARGTGAVNSGGQVTATGLASSRFFLETRTADERFAVEAAYSGGNATSFSVSPPLTPNENRVNVEAGHRRGVNDPLAAFILRGPALDAGLCNRTLSIFTGVERFDMALRYADSQTATSPRTGYQGPVVLCQMDYRPIAGHFTNSEITSYLANNQRMLAWYAPLGDSGYFIPYRVLIGTSLGDLSMVLTALQ